MPLSFHIECAGKGEVGYVTKAAVSVCILPHGIVAARRKLCCVDPVALSACCLEYAWDDSSRTPQPPCVGATFDSDRSSPCEQILHQVARSEACGSDCATAVLFTNLHFDTTRVRRHMALYDTAGEQRPVAFFTDFLASVVIVRYSNEL